VTTRAEFLSRIRREMARTEGLFPAQSATRPARPREAAEIIRRELAERWSSTLPRFRREFERVGGVFHSVARRDDIAGAVTALARDKGARGVVTWHPRALGVDVAPALAEGGVEAHVMPPAEVAPAERARLRAVAARADLGVTGVDLAVAETGTLVLRSGAGRPRSTSLLPPTHVAVLDPGALIESLAQLAVFLEAWHDGPPEAWQGANINLITGPSRTADIELTLTRGVHGPREVHALFVEGGLGEGGG
jgi:L-lactate dehydrogenase complex protein LldG